KGTFKESQALEQILTKLNDPGWRIRLQVAKALTKFNTPRALEALETLKKDGDHRVVGAALESHL
ncbi:MAG: HEAT repeat domain-containing protein, partial [Cyanobacteria bacterium P01_G01_bin.49]